jgi:hypothetical protein
MANHAFPERFNVHTHRIFRRVSVMLANGFVHGLVLLLKAAMMVRRGEGNKPEPQ